MMGLYTPTDVDANEEFLISLDYCISQNVKLTTHLHLICPYDVVLMCVREF
jgi:hypothetical protein